MGTEFIRVNPRDFADGEIARAAAAIRCGGLVGFPTETVYGIAVSEEKEGAIRRLYDLKDRARTKPLAYHIPDARSLEGLVPELPALAERLVRRYWPGPLTLVVPGLAGEKIGMRCPAHAVAQALLRAAGVRVLGTSANRAGGPEPRDAKMVLQALGPHLVLLLDGGPTPGALPSTVIDCTAHPPTVLRPGAVPAETIRAIVPEVQPIIPRL